MGLDSRDYARNDPRFARVWSPSSGSVTKTLIFVTILVFVAQMVTMTEVRVGQQLVGRHSLATDWLVMDFPSIQQGQVWRVLTYAFCHSTSTVLHIVFNLMIVWFAGRAVESLYGGREFLVFYLLSAIASAVTYIVLALAMGRGIAPMLGASGCAMACFTVFALHYPHAKILIFGIIPVEARFLLGFYVVFDMWPVLTELFGGNVGDGIAHTAHLGGLAFGLWYKASGVRLTNMFGWWDRWRAGAAERRRANPNVRIYEPTREELEERVDALLAKIQEHGEASLTDQEREFLKEASKHYRG